MYHEFFGLTEPAFSIAVNPRYLYMSGQHREALAHLLYGIQNGGFVMLTGEVGTGKTTIIRCLLEQLPENTDIAIILNPMANAPELLLTICDELGVSYIADDIGIKELTDSLNHFLLKNHRKGRRTVLLIDEAQHLKVPVLEQIRLLTNLETTTEKLLQIMLVGQPELKKLLARPALRQLSQRITARFHLEALSLPETHAYIAHRLTIGGLTGPQDFFSNAMIKNIHQFSGGIPRLINVLCERLLLGAYAKNTRKINNEIFQQAVLEISGTKFSSEGPPSKFGLRSTYHAVVISILMLIMAMVWRFLPDEAPAITPAIALSSASSSSLVNEVLLNTEVPPLVPEKQSASPTLIELANRDGISLRMALLNYLDISGATPENLCSAGEAQLYRCETTRIGSWDELKDINRPALLTLTAPEKKWVYVLLIGLSESEALLLVDGAEQRVPWSEVASLWNGDVLYVWSRPKEFDGTLEVGDQGPLVTWLAEQFAILDQQSVPLTRHFFTDKLKKRVELFQASQKMVPDGVVGTQTLRRLNEALGIDKSLKNVDQHPVPTAVKGR